MRKTISKYDLNERAATLADDFQEHLKEFKAAHPELEPVDEGRVFDAWTIQMLANLQVLSENLYRAKPLPLRYDVASDAGASVLKLLRGGGNHERS